MSKEDFISMVAPHAIASEEKYGVSAAVVAAQAILESGWGESELAKNANAYFGVKHSLGWPLADNPYVKGSYEKVSWEVINGKNVDVKSKFCMYDSLEDSMLDHGLFLRKQRYIPALNSYQASHDANQYARDIHAAGYATDPEYANKLIRLMNDHDLHNLDRFVEKPDLEKRVANMEAKMDRLYDIVIRLIDIMIESFRGK